MEYAYTGIILEYKLNIAELFTTIYIYNYESSCALTS